MRKEFIKIKGKHGLSLLKEKYVQLRKLQKRVERKDKEVTQLATKLSEEEYTEFMTFINDYSNTYQRRKEREKENG